MEPLQRSAFTPNPDALIPTSFNIQTTAHPYALPKRGKEIAGCIGQISFCIIDGGDPLITKTNLNTLANFTRYCPVGSNTLLGMGITHRSSTHRRSMGRLRPVLALANSQCGDCLEPSILAACPL